MVPWILSLTALALSAFSLFEASLLVAIVSRGGMDAAQRQFAIPGLAIVLAAACLFGCYAYRRVPSKTMGIILLISLLAQALPWVAIVYFLFS
jgi:hypothetical protein